MQASGVWQAQEDESGYQVGVGAYGDDFGAVAVDCPAEDWAEKEVECSEREEEDAGFEGVEGEVFACD